MNLRIWLIILFVSTCSFVHAAPAAVEAFAQPVLLGMQLSAKQGGREGKISEDELACIQALTPSAFYKVVEGVVTAALTSQELATANRFFGTPVGQKYLKHGLIGLYSAVGERAPEPIPNFSDSEYRQLEAFAATPAGQALITRRVMQSAAVKQSYSTRIRELMEQCHMK